MEFIQKLGYRCRMKKLIIASLFLCLNALALESLKIENGRYVAVENNLLDRSKPTLIFLPGINRGLDARDEFLQMAKKDHLNFISIHFSLHPESVLMIPENEMPYFKLHIMGAKDLANEVYAVIKKYKIAKPIIVGLSYSSVITSELAKSGKLKLIIETAPMMRFDESDPSGAQLTSFWKDYLGLNPVFGAQLQDYFLQQVYEKYWSQQIDAILKQYPSYRDNLTVKLNLVSAYAKLSIAVDGFDFSSQDFSTGTKRFFILGEQEEQNRFELQQAAVAKYEEQSGDQDSSYVIPGAGHIIPSDAPKDYLKLIKKVITTRY